MFKKDRLLEETNLHSKKRFCARLAEAGISTVNDLLRQRVNDLTKIKGIGHYTVSGLRPLLKNFLIQDPSIQDAPLIRDLLTSDQIDAIVGNHQDDEEPEKTDEPEETKEEEVVKTTPSPNIHDKTIMIPKKVMDLDFYQRSDLYKVTVCDTGKVYNGICTYCEDDEVRLFVASKEDTEGVLRIRPEEDNLIVQKINDDECVDEKFKFIIVLDGFFNKSKEMKMFDNGVIINPFEHLDFDVKETKPTVSFIGVSRDVYNNMNFKPGGIYSLDSLGPDNIGFGLASKEPNLLSPGVISEIFKSLTAVIYINSPNFAKENDNEE